jgi:hypothetical protein
MDFHQVVFVYRPFTYLIEHAIQVFLSVDDGLQGA